MFRITGPHEGHVILLQALKTIMTLSYLPSLVQTG